MDKEDKKWGWLVMVEASENLDTTLGSALSKEQARVRELLDDYREIGPSGAFGAAMIELALLRAYQFLRELS